MIRSLAPGVEIVSVRVLGTNLRGSAACFARGLEWCIDHDVSVANLSLSTTNERWFDAFHELIDRASYRRMLVVSAMANERKRTIPSEFAGVFSVACGPGHDRERVWCNLFGPAEWGACGIEVAGAATEGSQHPATAAAPGRRRTPDPNRRRPPRHHDLAGAHRARPTGGKRLPPR